MELEFWKLHGLGNDYLYFDLRAPWPMEPEWPRIARAICERHFGVGADGIIVIRGTSEADAEMRIWNADGSESEMCGNGLRALAKWLYDRGLATSDQVINTGAGLLRPKVVGVRNGKAYRIRVNMGSPHFSTSALGMMEDDQARTFINREIGVQSYQFRATAVSMGNPHLLIFGPLWTVQQMARFGPSLECHPWFPKRINVHSVEVRDLHGLRMRHWERGAGLTLACGTGVAAAVAASIRLELIESPVEVEVPGGTLIAEWSGDLDDVVYLTGPAEEVFHGYYPWTMEPEGN